MNRLIKNNVAACLFCLAGVSSVYADELPPVPNLGERIDTLKSQRPAPPERQRVVMEKAAQDLAAAMPDPGLKVGTRAPEFSLPDAFGNTTRLSAMLARGPVVLIFYRGAWCPYCNMQLHALKESLPYFQRYGLPVPGTFVIDREGFIRATFADVDYTKRMEPAAIINALAALEAHD